MIHQKKTRGHRNPRSLNSGNAITMAICPIMVHILLTLIAHSMYDVACEFASAVRMHRNN